MINRDDFKGTYMQSELYKTNSINHNACLSKPAIHGTKKI